MFLFVGGSALWYSRSNLKQLALQCAAIAPNPSAYLGPLPYLILNWNIMHTSILTYIIVIGTRFPYHKSCRISAWISRAATLQHFISLQAAFPTFSASLINIAAFRKICRVSLDVRSAYIPQIVPRYHENATTTASATSSVTTLSSAGGGAVAVALPYHNSCCC